MLSFTQKSKSDNKKLNYINLTYNIIADIINANL